MPESISRRQLTSSSSRVKSVLVIPCSGIGKAFGSVGREAMDLITEELRPDVADTVCLSLLTLGDSAAAEQMRTHPILTIDGCPNHCAVASAQADGAEPAATFRFTPGLVINEQLVSAGRVPEASEIVTFLTTALEMEQAG